MRTGRQAPELPSPQRCQQAIHSMVSRTGTQSMKTLAPLLPSRNVGTAVSQESARALWPTPV